MLHIINLKNLGRLINRVIGAQITMINKNITYLKISN